MRPQLKPYRCVKDLTHGRNGCAACCAGDGCLVFTYGPFPPADKCIVDALERRVLWKQL